MRNSVAVIDDGRLLQCKGLPVAGLAVKLTTFDVQAVTSKLPDAVEEIDIYELVFRPTFLWLASLLGCTILPSTLLPISLLLLLLLLSPLFPPLGVTYHNPGLVHVTRSGWRCGVGRRLRRFFPPLFLPLVPILQLPCSRGWPTEEPCDACLLGGFRC